MKKHIIIIAAAALALSCNSLIETAESGEVVFSASIEQYATKVSGNSFETGDRIGIFAGSPVSMSNVPYTVTDGGLASETPIRWFESQTAPVKFKAYYPYREGVDIYSSQQVFSVDNQTNKRLYSRSDILVSEEVEVAPGEEVALNFHHLFSRLDIVLEGDVPEGVNRIAVNGVYGSWSAAGGAEGETGLLAFNLSDNAWSVILPPQTVSPVIVLFRESGRSLDLQLDKSVVLESGKCSRLTLNFTGDGSPDVKVGYQIVDWNDVPVTDSEGYIPTWCLYIDYQFIPMAKVGKDVYELETEFSDWSHFKFCKDFEEKEVLGCPWHEEYMEGYGYYKEGEDLPASPDGGWYLSRFKNVRVKITLKPKERIVRVDRLFTPPAEGEVWSVIHLSLSHLYFDMDWIPSERAWFISMGNEYNTGLFLVHDHNFQDSRGPDYDYVLPEETPQEPVSYDVIPYGGTLNGRMGGHMNIWYYPQQEIVRLEPFFTSSETWVAVVNGKTVYSPTPASSPVLLYGYYVTISDPLPCFDFRNIPLHAGDEVIIRYRQDSEVYYGMQYDDETIDETTYAWIMKKGGYPLRITKDGYYTIRFCQQERFLSGEYKGELK